jgi:hypothetical protein
VRKSEEMNKKDEINKEQMLPIEVVITKTKVKVAL